MHADHLVKSHTIGQKKGGRASAPPPTRGVVVINFAWARRFIAIFATKTAWLHGEDPLLQRETIPGIISDYLAPF